MIMIFLSDSALHHKSRTANNGQPSAREAAEQGVGGLLSGATARPHGTAIFPRAQAITVN